MTLYDMNGELGRVDGGLGFSVSDPSFDFTMAPATDTSVLCDTDESLKSIISDCVKKVSEAYDVDPNVEVKVFEAPSAHSGFGSKTSLLLSTGQALLKLNGREADYRELATLLGRGGTSGVGINLIGRGGLVLDGGHSTDEKTFFAPSSASGHITPAPVLAHLTMPDWDVLLVKARSQKVFGAREIDFFKQICPIPGDDVDKLARTILSQILPGVVEARLDVFANGVNAIQTNVWKSQEIALHGPKMAELMSRIRDFGASAVGMSSFGPMLYALGDNLSLVKDRIELALPSEIESCTLTKPNNVGILFKEL
jgi:beta-ribofuranosylaminobenzene 5'-phosphate synthase